MKRPSIGEAQSMNTMNYILAAGDNIFEVLAGVVFFLIWVASAAMNALGKQKEKQRRERVRQEIETGRVISPPMPPKPQRPVQRQPTPRPIQRQPVQRPQAQRPIQAPKRPIPHRAPVPIEAMMQAPAPPQPAAAQTKPAVAVPARRSTSASAASLHVWLRPATLRQQFILTEVFQPPLALREPDARRTF